MAVSKGLILELFFGLRLHEEPPPCKLLSLILFLNLFFFLYDFMI